jgi:hypothetical protein
MVIRVVVHGVIQMAERKKKTVNREQELIKTFPLEDGTRSDKDDRYFGR